MSTTQQTPPIRARGKSTSTLRTLYVAALSIFFLVGGAEAQNYTVSDYAGLRGQSCSVGQTAEIRSGRYAGTFNCVRASDAWRTPFFDDSGIQIRSGTSGNIWKRSYAHSQSQPTDMGWYSWVGQNARVDTLVRNLTRDFSPNVFIRSPNVSGVDRLNWPSDVDLSGKTRQFYFIESGRHVIFEKQTIASGGYEHEVSFLRNDGGDVVVVGGDQLNMTFVGPAKAARPQAVPSVQTWTRPGTTDALSFYPCGENGGTFSTLVVKVNVKQPLGGSVGTVNAGCGSVRRWQNVTFGGVYEAAFQVNGSFDNVHLDNVVVQDPWGRRWGWTGGDYPNNNDATKAYKIGGTARVQKGGKLTGELTLQHGIKMFWAVMGQIGNSATDPFVIHYRDNCYSGPNTSNPGERISTNGINGNISKMDDLGTTGKYWFHLDREGDTLGDGCANTHFDFESTKNGSAANSGVTVTASGLPNSGIDIIDTGICQGGDRNDNHTIKGGALPNRGRVRMVDTVTLTGGTFEDVLITSDTCSGSGDNSLRDVTLTGKVTVNSSVSRTVIDNVKWSGSKRTILSIGSGSDVSITSGKIAAPSGSRIDGSGALSCGGVKQVLPFTFDGVEDACETLDVSITPPPPPPSSEDTDQDVSLASGWNLMSLNVEPADTKVENVVGAISTDMVVLKDNSGRLYYPEFGINTIVNWDVHEGYQINVAKAVTMTVGGQAVIDPSMPIELGAGWSLIPYILNVDQPIETALASILDHLVIVINNEGNVYYPQLNIDEIGTLRSGQGYRIYVDAPATLVFGSPG